MIGHSPLVEVQRQRAGIRAPDADVVAGLTAARQVEVDLEARLFFRHDQLPEQGVTRSLPGHRSVPEVVGGAEPGAQFFRCGHCDSSCSFNSALRVVGTCRASAWPRVSISSADLKELFSRLRTSAFLVDRILSSEFSAMVSASSIAASSALPVSANRSASPMRWASTARTVRPVNANSAARPGPISRTRFHDVPSSPMDSPIRTNPALKLAVWSMIRMSAARASDSPPPAAGPLTAAITGYGSARSPGEPAAAISTRSVNSGTDIRVRTSTWSRSKPVQNAFPPAPVTIKARTAALRNAAVAQAISPNISIVWEFARWGRLTDITSMPSRCSSKLRVRAVRSSSRTSVSGRRDTLFQWDVAVLMLIVPRNSVIAWL